MAGLMEAVGAAEKVFELIDRKPEIDHHSGSEKPDKLDGVVEFKKVSFSYPTRSDVRVLKEISFKAQPGEMVALVGKCSTYHCKKYRCWKTFTICLSLPLRS
jgi:ABC-type multidrug transport system fused ATPase/permease subunit